MDGYAVVDTTPIRNEYGWWISLTSTLEEKRMESYRLLMTYVDDDEKGDDMVRVVRLLSGVGGFCKLLRFFRLDSTPTLTPFDNAKDAANDGEKRPLYVMLMEKPTFLVASIEKSLVIDDKKKLCSMLLQLLYALKIAKIKHGIQYYNFKPDNIGFRFAAENSSKTKIFTIASRQVSVSSHLVPYFLSHTDATFQPNMLPEAREQIEPFELELLDSFLSRLSEAEREGAAEFIRTLKESATGNVKITYDSVIEKVATFAALI